MQRACPRTQEALEAVRRNTKMLEQLLGQMTLSGHTIRSDPHSLTACAKTGNV